MRTTRLVTGIAFSLLLGVLTMIPATALAQQPSISTAKQRAQGPVYLREHSQSAQSTTTVPVKRMQAMGATINTIVAPTNSSFLAATQIAVTGGAYAVVSGDFNGDSHPDVATVSYDSTTGSYVLNVLLDRGDGTFQSPISTPVSFGSSDRIYAAKLRTAATTDDIVVIHSGSFDVLLSNGNGTFATPVPYAVGASAVSAATVADVNCDSKIDVMVGDGSTGQITTYLGNGNGTFTLNPPATVSMFSDGIFADVNKDNKFDLVTNSSVYLANGTGGFNTPVTLSGAPSFTCSWLQGTIAVGDLNGDGFPDIVTADCTNNTVTVYLNNGTGGFGAGNSMFAGIDPQSVAIADVNGDGVPDLVAASAVSGDISVLLGHKVSGKGDGTFQAVAVGYALGGTLWAAPVIADFNGDGKLDIIAPLPADYAFGLTYLRGFGDGTFLAADTYYAPWTSGSEPWYGVGIASADFNGDGMPDFVLGNAGDSTVGVTVFLANSDGTLKPGVNYGSGGYSEFVATGDLDGDGHQDIVASDISSGNIYVFYGVGDGTFQSPVTIATGLGQATGIVVADFNKDGKPDIAVASSPSNVYVILNAGSRTFATPTAYTISSYGWEIAASDINGDGKLDLLVTQGGSSYVSILLGNGDGTFGAPTDFDLQYSYPNGLAIGDLNGDGKQDLAVAVDDNNLGMGIVVALGSGAGTFQTPQWYACSTASTSSDCYPGEVQIADVNHDGKLDLVYTNSQFATVGVMYGNGDGTFLSPKEFPVGGYPYSVVMADINGDGAMDAIVGNDGFSGVTVLLNTGRGSNTTVNSSGSPSTSGGTVTFTASVAAIGSVLGTPTGTVTFEDGSTALGTVSLVSGQAAIEVSNLSVGTHVITASYSGDSTFQQSASSLLQVVNALSPTYTLSANPSRAIIHPGQSATIIVTATPVGNFTGTINFDCGTLPAGWSCHFTPPALTLSNGQAASTTLVVAVAPTFLGYASPERRMPGHQFPLWASFATGLFGLVTLEGVSQRKRRQIAALIVAIILVLMMIALTGCGVQAPTPTPAVNSYTVQVIATAAAHNGGTTQQQLNITITVQR